MLKNLFATILLIIFILNSNIVENSEEDILKLEEEKISAAEYVCHNLELFRDYIQADYCEIEIPAYIVSMDKKGFYLDFNKDSGYMVITEDFEILEIVKSIDLLYLKNSDYVYYGVFDGFLYYDKGNYLPYENKPYIKQNTILNEKYSGHNDGDGDIIDTDAYVAGKYSDEYTLYENESIPFNYITQNELSIYFCKKDGIYYGEGNCTLASVYALMNNLKISKYPAFPSDKNMISYSAEKDSFYNKYKGSTDYNIILPKNLPELYIAVREYAVEEFGYETGVLILLI